MKTRRSGTPIRRRTRRGLRAMVAVALCALTLGGAGTIAATPEAQAAPGDSFDPWFPQVFIGQGFGTSLWTGQLSPGELMLTNTGTAALTYNAIGFNVIDGYIYGIRASDAQGTSGTNQLVRVGQNGVATSLGAVTGLPTPTPVPATQSANTYTQGAFGPNLDSGINYPMLYVRDYNNDNNDNKMWAIDVPTNTATQIVFASGTVTDVADFTWKDFDSSFPAALRAQYSGAFFGASPTRIYVITRSNSVTPVFTVTSYPNTVTGMAGANRQFGGAWTLGNGVLGFSDNPSGNVFYVQVNWSVAGGFAFEYVANFNGTATSNNDGTSSPGDNVDLAIDKTGPEYYAVGETLNYTMTVTNTEREAWSSGSILTDTPPSMLGNLTTTTPGCAVTSGTLRCVLGALGPGDSTEVNLSATVLSASAETDGLIENWAHIRGNEYDPNSANNSDDHDSYPYPPGILEVAKSSSPASGTQVSPGQLVHYTLTFHNSGGSTVAVDHVDDLTGVLDDADFDGEILTSPSLTADATTDQNEIAVTGTVGAGQTATVLYSMRVKSPLLSTSSGKLGNFLVAQGETPPSECDVETGLCTEHPVVVSLTWNKVNDHTPAAFLSGSEWTLTPYDDSVDPAVLVPAERIAVTDCVEETADECTAADVNPEAGRFEVRGLTIGDYQLAETTAPAGYRLLSPIDIAVFDDIAYGDIVNTQVEVPALPLTGGVGTMVFWGLTGGLGAVAATAYLLQRNRSRHASGAHARV